VLEVCPGDNHVMLIVSDMFISFFIFFERHHDIDPQICDSNVEREMFPLMVPSGQCYEDSLIRLWDTYVCLVYDSTSDSVLKFMAMVMPIR
jgi:hypothetical protein